MFRHLNYLCILSIFILTLTGCTSTSISAVRLTPTDPPSLAPTATAAHLPPVTTAPTLTSTATAMPSATPTPRPTPTDTPEPAELKYVVLISIDGLRPDALEIADTPTLDALRAAGAYSAQAKSVLPSVTLINHASMLSGMGPDKHGITWNELDPEAGKIKGPTLFSVAHEAGLSSIMVVGKPKLDHIVLPDSVEAFYQPGYTDRQVVNQALDIIDTGLPDILFIHLPDVDTAGHLTGWMGLGQLLAINLTDGLIGKIVGALKDKGLLENTLLIITADHGGSGLTHGTDSPEDSTIPWLAVGPGVPAGVTIKQEIITYDTAATILYALGLPIPEIWDGRPVTEIFEDGEK